ncbi:hypothetical protein [Aminirod propionatiphilus]|uniref:Uncharacterized protein n=1 Tax=Aminirod propionatiphilus TaxID=3415223 RepID=A0ACD1DUF7_9BACT|nr:hypothetical protein KIH16_11260 [Synergistota bacterium]
MKAIFITAKQLSKRREKQKFRGNFYLLECKKHIFDAWRRKGWFYREEESRSETYFQDPLLLSNLRVILITYGISPIVSRLLAPHQEIVGIVHATPRKNRSSAEKDG